MTFRGHLFLLVGPSGSGKTTIIQEICKVREDVRFLPTTTTRPPRPGETDGREYFFVSNEAFDEKLARGDFLEWKKIHGNRYGTSRERLQEAVQAGTLGIMSVDVLGGMEIRKDFPSETTAIFVSPSSLEELKERLMRRADTSDISTRLDRARMEMERASQCDVIITNGEGQLADAVASVLQVIDALALGHPVPRPLGRGKA